MLYESTHGQVIQMLYIIMYDILFSYTFQPFKHKQHGEHRDKTYYYEYAPALPDRNLVVHQRTYPQEQVTDSCSTQPQTLAQALDVFRSNFRNERKTQRRDEQFGYCQEEVDNDQYPRTSLQAFFCRIGHSLEFCS